MRQSLVSALAVATLSLVAGPTAGGSEGGPAPTTDTVRLAGAWFEQPLRRAVQGAALRLAEPGCAALLRELVDASGRTLRDRLDALGLTAPEYVRLVLFYDGSNEVPCRRPRVYAFTTPGSRIVRACPSLGRLVSTEPVLAEAVVIHELLHTLGLGENPPQSDSITAAVERRCVPGRR